MLILSTHIDEIRTLFGDKCLHVLAIQETKLDMSYNSSDFYIYGYELMRRDRLTAMLAEVYASILNQH